jgi:hypothetical protein
MLTRSSARLIVLMPNVMPLFGPFNPQVSARFGAA